MKFLVIIDESELEFFKKTNPAVMVKPIGRPMFVNEEGNSVYLTQPYIDALEETAKKISIEESVKQIKKTMDMVREYEEWKTLNGVMKMPKGLFDKIYNEAKEDIDDV